MYLTIICRYIYSFESVSLTIDNIHGTGLETCHVSALNTYKQSGQSVLREFAPHRCQNAALYM